jgi:histone-lysine N-methyltransferase SETMAR
MKIFIDVLSFSPSLGDLFCNMSEAALLVTSESLRFYVFARWKLGQKPTAIKNELDAVIGEESPVLQTICNWISKFQAPKFQEFPSLSDDPRAGRPLSAVTDENVALIRQIIDADPHESLEGIADRVSISKERVHHIVHHCLHLRKICARWVPHQLTPEQKALRVQLCHDFLRRFQPRRTDRRGVNSVYSIITGDEKWFYHDQIPSKESNKVWLPEGAPRPPVVRPAQNSPKTMFAIFFDCHGLVLKVALPHGETVNATFYRDHCMKPLLEILRQQNAADEQRPLLHHDNAAPHRAHVVTGFLELNNVEVIKHPPYSPDLAPADYFLFGRLTNALAGHHYSSVNGLSSAIFQAMKSIPENEYRAAFDKWLIRMQRCIDAEGDYFERM